MQRTPFIPARDPRLRHAALAFLCTVVPAGIALGTLTHGNSLLSALGEFFVTLTFLALWHWRDLRRQRRHEALLRDAAK